jgi:hypothetical protein
VSSIYGLFDATGALRYIGKANDPEHRLNCHVRDSLSGARSYPVNNWIRKNGRPELRVLEADCSDWRESERRLIAEARARGDSLLNVAEGGDEPYCSTSQRKANAAMCNQAMKDPMKRKARELKKTLTLTIKSMIERGSAFPIGQYQSMILKAYIAETKLPDLFGGLVEAIYSAPCEPCECTKPNVQ